MANAFWGAARKFEHPNFDLKTFKFVCSKCGESFDTPKPHAQHIFDNHSQEFAYENMPSKFYHQFYKTDEWKRKKARQKIINDHKKLIRKAGIIVHYSRRMSWFSFFDKETDKRLSHEEVKARVPEFNYDILIGRLEIAGINIDDYI